MNYIISGKNLELTEALKEYAEDKINKLEKLVSPDTEVIVTMKLERELHIIEVHIISAGDAYRATVEDKDMYAAIDKISDVLHGQIRKEKEKKEAIAHKSDTIREGEPCELCGDHSRVEHAKGEINVFLAYSMKPMDPQDAKIILEDSKELFFTFVNIADGKTNVIFKTKDGNFGLVEPQR